MNSNLRALMLEAGYACPEMAGRAQKLSELIINRVISVYNDTETFRTSTFDDNRVLDYFGVKHEDS